MVHDLVNTFLVAVGYVFATKLKGGNEFGVFATIFRYRFLPQPAKQAKRYSGRQERARRSQSTAGRDEQGERGSPASLEEALKGKRERKREGKGERERGKGEKTREREKEGKRGDRDAQLSTLQASR